MNAKLTSIISYLTIVGWFVAFIFGDRDDELAEFHLNQGLVLGIVEIVVSAILTVLGKLWLIGFLAGILSTLLGVVFLVLMIIGIVNAANEAKSRCPQAFGEAF